MAEETEIKQETTKPKAKLKEQFAKIKFAKLGLGAFAKKLSGNKTSNKNDEKREKTHDLKEQQHFEEVAEMDKDDELRLQRTYSNQVLDGVQSMKITDNDVKVSLVNNIDTFMTTVEDMMGTARAQALWHDSSNNRELKGS